MINNAIPNAYMKGIALPATFIGGMSDKVPATNKSSPKGGVAKPIDKQHTIITPKCTGSTPIDCTAGSRMGDSITMAGPVSITIPSNKKITTIPVKTDILDVKLLSIKFSISAGALAKAKTRPKAIAKARTKHKGAYVFTAFLKKGIICFKVNDL